MLRENWVSIPDCFLYPKTHGMSLQLTGVILGAYKHHSWLSIHHGSPSLLSLLCQWQPPEIKNTCTFTLMCVWIKMHVQLYILSAKKLIWTMNYIYDNKHCALTSPLTTKPIKVIAHPPMLKWVSHKSAMTMTSVLYW